MWPERLCLPRDESSQRRARTASANEILGVDARCLSASRYVQLLENIAEIVLDGLLAQLQGGCDFLVGLARRYQRENPALLLGQLVALARRRDDRGHGAHAVEDDAGRERIENRMALRHRLYGVDQDLAADLLEQVSPRAREDGGEDRLVVMVGGQKQHANLR